MITLKFPPLHNLVSKDTKELADDDPKKGIVVIKDHAIVTTHKSMVFFNLKNWFIKDLGIDSDDMLEELGAVLDYMDGKMFFFPFWAELTKGAVVSVEGNHLELDGAVRKDLFYRDHQFDDKIIIEALENNLRSGPVAVSRHALYVEPILAVMNKLKGFVGNDTIAIESVGVNTNIRFTFEGNPWIFGITSTDPGFTGQHFVFNPMSIYYQELKK